MNDNERSWEASYRFLHPKITHLPDLGVQLSTADETEFRMRAEKNGLNYDELKEKFAMSHQVIPPRPHKIGLALIEKGAIPQNSLSLCFRAYLYETIAIAREKRKTH